MATHVAEPIRDSAPTTEAATRVRSSTAQSIAGALLTLAGVVMVMGWITAEALYPQSYSTHTDSLSHLGATEPPNSIVLQPSATIFDLTVLFAGAMLIGAAFFTYRAFRFKRVSIPIGVFGLGAFGVGVFPLTSPTQHTLFATLAFYGGGIAMILASSITPKLFRYIWSALGVVALVAITAGFFLLSFAPVAGLGEGGIERWNTYPIVLWLVAFGSYLLAGRRIGEERS